jgi:hypothetical protein
MIFEIQHAMALYARGRGEFTAAEQIWRELLGLSAQLGGQKYVVNRRWLATCRYQQGDLDAAQQLYRASLQDATQIGDQRSVIGNMLKLIAIDLDRGNIAGADARLADCYAAAERLQDRRRLGELQHLSARLCMLRGDPTGARAALGAAVDLFERLGMRGELAEAQGALARLAAE